MTDCIIKLENVSFDYSETTEESADSKIVINNISLEIKKGSFVAVLGHNGSGKSTLAKLFNGIYTPKSGRVLVNGLNTSDETLIYDIRKTVGMAFQNPDNQIVATTVEEDVAFAPENLGIRPDEIRKRVDSALETVGMSAYKKHAPHRLSGGQKQRVAIAGIIAMMPECIIFDESTAMLDPIGRQEVMQMIKHLNREMNITVVLITHYMSEAVEADRVIVMNDGKIEMDDTPAKVFSHVEKLKNIGLDVPQVTELIYLLKKSGFDLPDGVLDEEMACELILNLVKGGKAVEHQT